MHIEPDEQQKERKAQDDSQKGSLYIDKQKEAEKKPLKKKVTQLHQWLP